MKWYDPFGMRKYMEGINNHKNKTISEMKYELGIGTMVSADVERLRSELEETTDEKA